MRCKLLLLIVEVEVASVLLDAMAEEKYIGVVEDMGVLVGIMGMTLKIGVVGE